MKTVVKILAVLALVACVVTLFSACNSEGDDDEDDDFCVTYKNVEIALGKSADNVISKLGTPKSKTYAGNCGGNGDVYQYQYNGIVINVLTDGNGKSTIDQIKFMDDSVNTSKGIYIGKTSDDVVKAHGKPTQQTNSLIEYKKGSFSLQFTIVNGQVKNISYFNIT